MRLVEVIFKDIRIEEQILAAKAELKEKHQELVLLVPSSGRSRSDTPARHHRFQAEESSPESTENVSENVSQGNIETLKTEILELKGKKRPQRGRLPDVRANARGVAPGAVPRYRRGAVRQRQSRQHAGQTHSGPAPRPPHLGFQGGLHGVAALVRQRGGRG